LDAHTRNVGDSSRSYPGEKASFVSAEQRYLKEPALCGGTLVESANEAPVQFSF